METSGWIAGQYHLTKNKYSGITVPLEQGYIFTVLYPDFATCFILIIEKNVENTAFGLYFFGFYDIIIYRVIGM